MLMDPSYVQPPPLVGRVSSPTLNVSPPVRSTSSGNTNGNSFPVIAVAIIGILATALLLVGYYVFVIKCCLNWHRIDPLRRFSSLQGRRRQQNRDDPATTYSPGATARGLEESVIRAIPTIRFRIESKQAATAEESLRLNGNNNSYECAVCLSEFQQDEKLRVIPNCCHAFHIDCIDIWLQNNANCPLCRSSISANSLFAAGQIIAPTDSDTAASTITSVTGTRDPAPSSSSPTNRDSFSVNDNDDDDFVVILIHHNNLDEPRIVSRQDGLKSGDLSSSSFSISPPSLMGGQRGGCGGTGSDFSSKSSSPRNVVERNKNTKKKFRHVSSMGDECIIDHVRENENIFQIQPLRRSISMDSSGDPQLYLQIQYSLQQQKQKQNKKENSCSNDNTKHHITGDFSLSEYRSNSNCDSSSRVRKSFFSFGNGGRGSRSSAVLPLH